MAKKNPSIFSTLQKTTANASAVNGEFTALALAVSSPASFRWTPWRITP